MRVVVESELPCGPDAVWDEVKRSRLLKEVCAPLVTFRETAGRALPDAWPEGQTILVNSWLFGLVPLGTRVIRFVRVDAAAGEIVTRERDPLVRRWDHTISVRPAANGRTRYRDEVIVEAGLLTPLVWLFAQVLYRHRQRRWRRVATRLAAA
jgi:hypothetical protein